jgi:superfamily II DNA or RNA helicase
VVALALPELRPYQVEQVEAVMRFHHVHQVRSVLVVAATGTGKTTSAGQIAYLAVENGETVLFLAHRSELITQAARRFTEDFGLDVGIEQGASYADAEPVVCASVATLRGKRLAKFPRDSFDVIIVDEAHHAAAQSYKNILDHFDTARVVGVTASPDRADGKPLASVFDYVAHRYEIEDAIDDGYLVPVRGIQVVVPGMDLSKVRSRRQIKRVPDGLEPVAELLGETVDLLAPAGQARVAPSGDQRYSVDLHPTDLGAAVIDPLAVEGVAAPLIELAGDRRTVVFAVDIRHASAIVASLCAKREGCARVVHGKLKKRERRAVLAAHRACEFQFLVNCMLLTEGYDDPAIACVAMARPTMSRVLYSQAVGRALRLFAGKSEALLLDFVGVGSKFDLVGPEDALAGALKGPVARVSPSDVARWKARRAAKAQAAAEAEVAELDVGFSTKVIELIRGAGKRVGGWFSKLFG